MTKYTWTLTAAAIFVLLIVGCAYYHQQSNGETVAWSWFGATARAREALKDVELFADSDGTTTTSSVPDLLAEAQEPSRA